MGADLECASPHANEWILFHLRASSLPPLNLRSSFLAPAPLQRAHAFKGTAANLGLVDLASTSLTVETIAAVLLSMEGSSPNGDRAPSAVRSPLVIA